MTALSVVIVLVAAAFWIWLVQRILPGRISPQIVIPALVFGALSPLPVLLGFRFGVPPWLDAESGLGDAFLVALTLAALPEEIVKLASAVGVLWVVRSRIDPGQAFRVPILVGLAFAAVENIFYSFNPTIATFAAAEFGSQLAIPLMRSILSSLLHASLGCLMGYFLARPLVFSGGQWRDLLLALGIPVLGHALVNWGLIVPAFAIASGNPVDAETMSRLVPHLVLAAVIIPLVIASAGYCLVRMRRFGRASVA